MGKRKTATSMTKLLWRISERAPMGELVDPAAPPARPPETAAVPEVLYGGWVASSFDLLHGTDITEEPDTVPGDLYDELFAPPAGAAKGAGSK